MKPETLIYEKVRNIIPDSSEKSIFFAAISQSSYEVFFYSYFEGVPIQCYELAQRGELDENELDQVFESIVGIIKDSKAFMPDQYNIATIKVDISGIGMSLEYYDKDARMYQIKKEWREKQIS